MVRRLVATALGLIAALAALASPANAEPLHYDSAAFSYPGEYRQHTWGDFGENLADSSLDPTVQAKYDANYHVHYYRLRVDLDGSNYGPGGPIRYELDRVSLVSSSGATVFSVDAKKLAFHGSLAYTSKWGSTCGCHYYRAHVIYYVRWPDGIRQKRDYYSGWHRGTW